MRDLPQVLLRWIPPSASLTRPPQGMTSDVAFIEGTLEPLVLKHCHDAIYLPWLRREHEVLRALAGSGLPIPRVRDFVDDGNEAWLVMTRVPGISLWQAMLEATPATRGDLLSRLGALLARLHATPVPPSLEAATAWIDRKLAEAEQNLSWCDGSRTLLDDLHRRRPPPHHEALIHGDLALDNIVVAPDRTMSLIDWPSGDLGDPRCDLALPLQTEPELVLGLDEIAAFFKGYGAAPLDHAVRRWFVDLYEFF